jgi:hypothetical protein
MEKDNLMLLNRGGIKALKHVLDRSTTPPMKRTLLSVWSQLIDANIQYRKLTGWEGRLPDFIIIGTQKGGTTYLYDELIKHPCISPALVKEVGYFDMNMGKGLDWYKSFFTANPATSDAFLTGEASPDYLFHPTTPRRVARILPHVKLIVLLRNPIKRAHSHYHHEVRLGFETMSFAEALAVEEARTIGEKEKMFADKDYYSHNYMHFSYRARGMYADQLRAWFKYFPREQMLILRSEDFYKNTPAVIQEVCEFLGLPANDIVARARPRMASYDKLDESIRNDLRAYFEPYNRDLYQLLNRDFGWEN